MSDPARDEPPPDQSSDAPGARRCPVCEVKLSAYNSGPYCWRHTIGHPYRGPTAKPKY